MSWDGPPRLTPSESIYELLGAHRLPDGRLDAPDLRLPDAADAKTGGLQWAPGALEGVLGHHAGGGGSDDTSARAVAAADAFARACESPSESNLRALHDLLLGDSVLGFIDPMISELAAREPDAASLHALGRWLATTSSDRGAVKVGLAIMGATGVQDDRDLDIVRTLGAHEDLTLYAAVALRNGLPDPTQELWAMARRVDGWGRIQCVERLTTTDDPAIRDWILREGFRNTIMDEYLAYTAATTGGLLDALRVDHPDRELLTSAGQIFEALVRGGPAEDLDDYADGADAIDVFLRHMDAGGGTIGDLNAVASIRSWLADADADWEDRVTRGWTTQRRVDLLRRCEAFLRRPEWPERIGTAVRSSDRAVSWAADQAAKALGIDTFDLLVERIRAGPLGTDWFAAWAQADADRATTLAQLATQMLPLDAIATGPADELGLGLEWRPHQVLDTTLQSLRGYPGVGSGLLLVGLRSPVVRNRNPALQALTAWPPGQWPDGARALVEDLARTDPNERTRELAAQILAAPGA